MVRVPACGREVHSVDSPRFRSAAQLDTQLGSLVIVEAAQGPDHMLLREPPHALGDTHLLALDDELHAETLHTAIRRRTALTLRVSRV